jgi:hypothetical protein
MLDALFGFVFEMVLNLVGAAIAKLFGADDVAEAGSIIVGIGILAIGFSADVARKNHFTLFRIMLYAAIRCSGGVVKYFSASACSRSGTAIAVWL